MFQVYGVSTINNVEYESERSSPVTVMITMDSSTPSSSSIIGCTGLLASVSVLSVIVVTSLVANVIFILFKILNKKPKEKERFSNN